MQSGNLPEQARRPMALTGCDCLMEPRSIGTVVLARTAGLLACINECSFWRSQNERLDASWAEDCGAPWGNRARRLDPHDAIRQSPEQARRPAVRAHTVSRTSASQSDQDSQISPSK